MQETIAQRKIFSVSEITYAVKNLLEGTFSGIWVEGELSNCHPHTSGHFYCSLKDNASILGGIMYGNKFKEVKFRLEDGLKVLCYGAISIYAPQGKYQLVIEKVEPKGIGALQLALEQLKEKLEKDGLFASAHKRPIPYLPATIGIVTSLTGAAIKDMLKVVERRFKDVHILIYPVRVQGDGAKEEISQAIKDFNAYNQACASDEKIEVLIVGRGGGSIEDLWAFNEEVVCRAIYNSRIPVISAVGHERDVTISDLVADVRAATPSVAAELVLPKKEDLKEQVDSLRARVRDACRDMIEQERRRHAEVSHRLAIAAGHILELNKNYLLQTQKKLTILNPAVQIPEYMRKIVDRARQIFVRMEHMVKMKDARLAKAAGQLAGLNPLNILARGYSVTFALPGMGVIKDAKMVKPGERIKTTLASGEIVSEVKEVTEWQR